MIAAMVIAAALVGGAPPDPLTATPTPTPNSTPNSSLASGLGDGLTLPRALWFAGGAATGFLAHEACHVGANLAFGNVPRLHRVTFAGALPFFTIDHGITCFDGRCTTRDGHRFGAGRAGLGVILSAGFQCQHVEDEVLLTTRPDLRTADAPFRVGMLAFNTLASVAYVVADVGRFQPPEGDLAGLYRDARAPRRAVNALLLGAAALDVARFVWPDQAWLAWTSRAVKVGAGGIVFTL